MVSRSQIKAVQSLKQKKYRQKYGLFSVSGDKIVRELLTSDWSIHKIYALKDWIKENEKLLHPHTASVVEVGGAMLERLSVQKNPNSVLAIAEIPVESPTGIFADKAIAAPEIEAKAGIATETGWFLALDRMRDPGNLGTLIRTADWFGLKGIYCSPDSADRFNPKVVQASMGSVFRLPVYYTSLEEHFETIAAKGPLQLYGATMVGKSMYEVNFGKSGILLIGNESQGISADLKKYVQHAISVPGRGGAESLNATTATAVLLGQIFRP